MKERNNSLLPITSWLSSYKKELFQGDIFAGLTVGVMLIPQGMAYALIAGLPPVYGLYAAITPQVIYAILGTSRQLSVAPVAMDSLLVAAGVGLLATEGTEQYISLAILLALLVGIIQILLGLFKLGFITNLLSKPVISGFTSAAALIIGLNQLKYVIGTDIEKSNQVYKILFSAFQNLENTHVLTFSIAIGSITLIKLIKKLSPRIPGALLAVTLGTLIVYVFNLSAKGVSIVQDIPEGLPVFMLPELELETISKLLPLAFTIAVIAFMEAYSVAKAVEAKKKDHKVNANQELLGIGAANFIGSIFQSFPVTGGFSRTAVNYQSGANTPLASLISASLVAITLLFFTPLFYHLPHAVLGAIIIMAVSNLFDYRYARKLFHDSKVEFLILLTTFLITLNIGMITGIVTGIIVSLLLFLYKAAYPHVARLGRIKGHREFRNIKRFSELDTWDTIAIIRVDAPLSFINIQEIREYINQMIHNETALEEIIIDAGPVSHLDTSAADGFQELLTVLNEKNIRVVLCDVIGPVRDTMKQTGLTNIIGEENLFLSINEALDNALENREDPFKKMTLQSNVDT
ncbi:MAG: solute carrier family 26 protein [Bacteroidota bacterium]